MVAALSFVAEKNIPLTTILIFFGGLKI